MKLEFRKKLTELKIKNEEIKVDVIVKNIMNNIDNMTAIKCASHGWK